MFFSTCLDALINQVAEWIVLRRRLFSYPRRADLAFGSLFGSQAGPHVGVCVQRSESAVHLVLSGKLLHFLCECGAECLR
jgi:hypothetical protein